MSARIFLSVVAALATIPAYAQDSSITLQSGINGYDGCQDAQIIENVAIRSGGVLDSTMWPLPQGNDATIDVYHAKSDRCESTFDPLMIINGCIIKFDLSSVPGNIPINNVKLSLYAVRTDSLHHNAPKVLFPVTVPWDEQTVTADALFTGVMGIDPEIQIDGGDSAIGDWENFDVTSLVQEMLSGTRENDGFLIMFKTSTDAVVENDLVKSSCNYAAHENSDPSIRPKLLINNSSNANPITVAAEKRPYEVTVSPNGRNDIRIMSSKYDVASVKICRADGRIVKSFANVNLSVGSNKISVGNLASGTYFVSVNHASSSKTFRLIEE